MIRLGCTLKLLLLSAWLFGEQLTARKWLAAALTFSGLVVTLGLELAGQPLGIALGVAALLIAWEFVLARHRGREACFRAFLHNNWVGAAVFAGIAAQLQWGIPGG